MQGGVQVWTANPDGLGCAACQAFAGMLDPMERERASRLQFDSDRRAFVVAHAMRRMALGLALGIDPQEVRFGSGPHGQPLLLGNGGDAPFFSLTRSRGLVAVAVDWRGPVGIDVELLRDGVDAGLLEAYMDHGEQPPQDDEAFYAHWTALEAYWKARGLGLSTSHPRIALRPCGDGCLEVLVGEARSASGLVVMRMPGPATHVLSLACTQAAPVQWVELEALAPRPPAQPQKAETSCKSGDCWLDSMPSIFSS